MKLKTLHSILLSHGFSIIRESKHHIYGNHYGVSIAIPHARDIAVGTLRDIFKQLYPNDFGLANKMMRQELGKAS